MESPSQVLIGTLEDFGQSEPTHILVIYINENGFLTYRSNIDSVTLRVGMCETAKSFFLSDMNQHRHEH